VTACTPKHALSIRARREHACERQPTTPTEPRPNALGTTTHEDHDAPAAAHPHTQLLACSAARDRSSCLRIAHAATRQERHDGFDEFLLPAHYVGEAVQRALFGHIHRQIGHLC
jgi:hypothetical protein